MKTVYRLSFFFVVIVINESCWFCEFFFFSFAFKHRCEEPLLLVLNWCVTADVLNKKKKEKKPTKGLHSSQSETPDAIQAPFCAPL